MFFVLAKCGWLYNLFLEKKQNENLKKKELQAMLPKLKNQFPEFKNVHSKTLQYVLWQMCVNLKALHGLKENGKKVGRLRFKGWRWYKTFVYNQSGFKIIRNSTRYDFLQLSKIGKIPFIMHREIVDKVKQIIVKHYPSGKWYASVQVNDEDIMYQKTESDKKVGIDLGVINYVYDSDGNHFEHPKLIEGSLRRLRREQRRLSRKTAS